MNSDIPHVIAVISGLSVAVIICAALIEMYLRLDDKLNAFYASLDRYNYFIEYTKNKKENLVNGYMETHTASATYAYDVRLSELLSELKTAYTNLPIRCQRNISKECPLLELTFSSSTNLNETLLS